MLLLLPDVLHEDRIHRQHQLHGEPPVLRSVFADEVKVIPHLGDRDRLDTGRVELPLRRQVPEHVPVLVQPPLEGDPASEGWGIVPVSLQLQ